MTRLAEMAAKLVNASSKRMRFEVEAYWQLTMRSFFLRLFLSIAVGVLLAIMALSMEAAAEREFIAMGARVDAGTRMLEPGTTVVEAGVAADLTRGRLTLFNVGSLAAALFGWSNVAWLSKGWMVDWEGAAMLGLI